VAGKLLDHAQTENWTLNGMMQNVEPDQPRIQIAVGFGAFLL
jgi:hypothetical protein